MGAPWGMPALPVLCPVAVLGMPPTTTRQPHSDRWLSQHPAYVSQFHILLSLFSCPDLFEEEVEAAWRANREGTKLGKQQKGTAPGSDLSDAIPAY